MSAQAIELFREAIRAAGLTPPDTIHGDGTLHRFSTNGKRGDDSGWYVLHLDGLPAGAFGCWRQGLQSTWCAVKDSDMTQAERHANRQRFETMKAMRDAEEAKAHAAVAAQAQRRFDAASKDAQAHPYIAAKGILSHGARVEADGTLLVPMRDSAGKLWNVERINPKDFSDKRGLPGGRRKGCYFSIGKPAGLLVICEGFATGASIHEATGNAVAVAFNAGNLKPVAAALRSKYPDRRLMLAADDDWRTEGNPGITQATTAAAAAGALLAVPSFGADRPEKATDFNDLRALSGTEAVKRCFELAHQPQSDDWPRPGALPDALPPVDTFDAELVPQALREWVMDIAHRMQCPADFPAVAAIVGLSSLIGARAVMQPKARDDWQVVPNLWGVCVGRPGVKKSPAVSEALKPLQRLQAREQELWEAQHEAWKLDAKVCALANADREKKAKGLVSKDPAGARALLQSDDSGEPEPVARRYIVNDATVEKLGELLKENPWGTLSYRDELYGLLTSLDKQGQEGSRAFYLQAYDGNSGYTFDRIGRGTVHVPRVCLAMIGGIQPGRIQEYVRGAVSGGSGDDGLLQRFGLAVWPDADREIIYVDQWPDTPARQRAWDVFERLAALQLGDDGMPRAWRFTPNAQAMFAEWFAALENELRSADLHPALCSHLAKFRKLIPALALIFAIVDTPDSDAVGEQELMRAFAWADYLRSHARRLYSAAVQPETSAARALLGKLRAGKLANADGELLQAFTPRQVAQKCWAGLGTPDTVRKAADVLADWDYLRSEAAPGGASGGRPSERYRISPWLFQEGHA